MSESRPRRLSQAEYVEGILQGNRATLSRAITVIESELPSDAEISRQILEGIQAHAGDSLRIGITGVPGAGKSTFIDALGMHLVHECGEKVAVVSVDPSSPVSGGSILGDKTRMARLSKEEKAFIRPSPARGYLGGVARHTREAILLCEAAGFRNVLVETVGVGQSETAVRSMTDFFLLLMIPGAGDALQGIKRGIIEMLDCMVINKADGDNKSKAERARSDYAGALRLFPAGPGGWVPKVLTCSALHSEGIAEIWDVIVDHRRYQTASGQFEERRRRQSLDWMHELISVELERIFRADTNVQKLLPMLEEEVRRGRTTAFGAARELIARFTDAGEHSGS